MKDDPCVGDATFSDTRAIAGVIARSFYDIPFIAWAFEGLSPAETIKQFSRAMIGLAGVAIRWGRVRVLRQGDEIVAVAIAYPPDNYPLSGLAWLLSGIGILATGIRTTQRFIQYEAVLKSLHIPEPHFYLQFLGVKPEMKGRGFGSILTRDLCSIAEYTGHPCYVETDKRENVPFYERHGYRVLEQRHLNEIGGIDLWCMARRDENV